MLLSRLTSIHLLICAAIAVSAAASSAQEPMLVKGGQAEAAIVIAPDASEFARWLAGELAGHLKKLSGAELPIVTADKLPAGKPLVVLGGPQANPLAAAAEARQLAKFTGLKPDGFVLKRTELDGVPVLLAGGNDEVATMYAAYDVVVAAAEHWIAEQEKAGTGWYAGTDPSRQNIAPMTCMLKICICSCSR
ncbi:MAG: hypothetical protein HUU20_21205 [Pirellulales bacterium]|nr:hypothetical protein [Pirellulales bacterium]